MARNADTFRRLYDSYVYKFLCLTIKRHVGYHFIKKHVHQWASSCHGFSVILRLPASSRPFVIQSKSLSTLMD